MTVMDTLQREILEVKMEQEMISLADKALGKAWRSARTGALSCDPESGEGHDGGYDPH